MTSLIKFLRQKHKLQVALIGDGELWTYPKDKTIRVFRYLLPINHRHYSNYYLLLHARSLALNPNNDFRRLKLLMPETHNQVLHTVRQFVYNTKHI